LTYYPEGIQKKPVDFFSMPWKILAGFSITLWLPSKKLKFFDGTNKKRTHPPEARTGLRFSDPSAGLEGTPHGIPLNRRARTHARLPGRPSHYFWNLML
jgi:hypothetical protein